MLVFSLRSFYPFRKSTKKTTAKFWKTCAGFIEFLILIGQVSGVTGQLGALVPRPVAAEEGVTELAHAKEEPHVWAPRKRLKSVKYRIAQVRDRRV